ncbi:hypothetical protein Tco_0562609 [Tanacetum coccineum]
MFTILEKVINLKKIGYVSVGIRLDSPIELIIPNHLHVGTLDMDIINDDYGWGIGWSFEFCHQYFDFGFYSKNFLDERLLDIRLLWYQEGVLDAVGQLIGIPILNVGVSIARVIGETSPGDHSCAPGVLKTRSLLPYLLRVVQDVELRLMVRVVEDVHFLRKIFDEDLIAGDSSNGIFWSTNALVNNMCASKVRKKEKAYEEEKYAAACRYHAFVTCGCRRLTLFLEDGFAEFETRSYCSNSTKELFCVLKPILIQMDDTSECLDDDFENIEYIRLQRVEQ